MKKRVKLPKWVANIKSVYPTNLGSIIYIEDLSGNNRHLFMCGPSPVRKFWGADIRFSAAPNAIYVSSSWKWG